METGIDQAAEGLEALINRCRGDIDAALRQVDPSCGLKQVFGYYHENISNDDYPLLMIQESSESLTWIALPNIAENVFQFNIYGFVAHDDPRTCVRLRRALASAFKRSMNRAHMGVRLGDGTEIEFTAPNLPVYSINYNVSIANTGVFVRGFIASFQAECHPSIAGPEGVLPGPSN